MKKWDLINKFKVKSEKLKVGEVIDILLENRGIKTKKEREAFLNPKLEDVTLENVGINKKQLKIALKRIQIAIEKKEQIIVFGDYDVDGICGAAILWETLNSIGANVLPYIPHRVDQGYGLSIKGIEDLLSTKRYALNAIPSLIITVDNGIVANDAVDFAKKKGIDVIITDHHVPGKKLPKAHAIVHTTKLCGTGVAWMLSQVILNLIQHLRSSGNEMPDQVRHDKEKTDNHLELVALATVADLVPLIDANRILLKFGLERLKDTKRVGIIALCRDAAIDQKTIDTYAIGHVIAPRLNAMGRLEYAMESLRLLCTRDKEKASMLAMKLSATNKERQVLTEETKLHALTQVRSSKNMQKLLFIAHESYQQGVIGLVAGKLVEEFYRPSIVVSIGEKHSKASARSVHGFNIIEFIRSASEHLVDAGGHPMAAGFTVETEKLHILKKALEELAHTTLNEDMLIRTLRIDCEIPFSLIDETLYAALNKLSPFGMGNPQPTFVSRGIVIEDIRLVGADKKHAKFKFSTTNYKSRTTNDAIGFGLGERSSEFHVGDTVDIVYTVDENVWNGETKLQLKIKDIKVV